MKYEGIRVRTEVVKVTEPTRFILEGGEWDTDWFDINEPGVYYITLPVDPGEIVIKRSE